MSKSNAKAHVDLIRQNPDLVGGHARRYLEGGNEIADILAEMGEFPGINAQILHTIKDLKNPNTFILNDKQSERNLSLLKEEFPEFAGTIGEVIGEKLSSFIHYCYEKGEAQLGLIKEELLPKEKSGGFNTKIGVKKDTEDFHKKYGNLYIKNGNDINLIDGHTIRYAIHVDPQKTGEIQTPLITVIAIQQSNSKSDSFNIKVLENKEDYEYVKKIIEQIKEEARNTEVKE